MKQEMKVLVSMNTGVWYTPPWYLELVRQVFDANIALDPASSKTANRLVKADHYFTIEDDGLTQLWKAQNVFMNPPYSIEGQRVASTSTWVDKALAQYRVGNYREGIFLVNFKAGYNWMNDLIDGDRTLVFLHRKRIGFVDPETMKESKPSRQPQATIYLGANPERFNQVFGHLGWTVGKEEGKQCHTTYGWMDVK